MSRAKIIALNQEPEARIKNAFDNILSNYLRARRKPFGREPALWKVFEAVCEHLENHVSNRPTLKIKWSVGRGGWVRVPWIAIVDERETKSTRHGVYPVYLFREDLSGVYITLNQGIDLLKDEQGAPASRRILREHAEHLRSHLPAFQTLKDAGFSTDNGIDLHTTGKLVKNYEASIVSYKFYRRSEIPHDPKLLKDLEQLLVVYDEYLQRLPFSGPQAPALKIVPKPAPKHAELSSATQEVISYIANRGFVYAPWQIAQYITAIRTKPFLILGGVSGTGKSKLAAMIAEATGGVSKLLPVRPDWTDSSEVLGYSDLEDKFRPGPVLEIARAATADPDLLHTCILDEMNLARVEQYFAEVLSKIEDRVPQANGGYRTKQLLGQTVRGTDPEWVTVCIPENLAIVGTVNVDESTHGFSRKVLDRAFTIELSEVHLRNWKPNGGPVRAPSTWPMTWWNPIKIHLSELSNATAAQLSEINRAITALDAINQLLGPAQLQIAYRTRDEVAFYLLHAQQISDAFIDGEGDAVDPLDLALQMKILPRITGSSSAIRKCVLGLLGWATNGTPLESGDQANSLLKRWEKFGRPSTLINSKYPRLSARLCLMWQRLDADGYTSYWL
jgi:MrcB-like, N-terminal domain/AAA domain (dynein-related subfamily)